MESSLECHVFALSVEYLFTFFARKIKVNVIVITCNKHSCRTAFKLRGLLCESAEHTHKGLSLAHSGQDLKYTQIQTGK